MSASVTVKAIQVLRQKYGPDLVVLTFEGLTPAMADMEEGTHATIHVTAGAGTEWVETNFPGMAFETLPSRM